jgi:hypothetical protein
MTIAEPPPPVDPPAHTKPGWLIGLLCISVLLALLFTVGGAGLYGSPFGPGKVFREYALYAAAIISGPVATLCALVLRSRAPVAAAASLLAGALAGLCFGVIAQSDFRHFWGWVFLIAVWLPMWAVGLQMLGSRRKPG